MAFPTASSEEVYDPLKVAPQPAAKEEAPEEDRIPSARTLKEAEAGQRAVAAAAAAASAASAASAPAPAEEPPVEELPVEEPTGDPGLVYIPDDWRTFPAAEKRAIADDINAANDLDPVANATEAAAVIDAELARRAG